MKHFSGAGVAGVAGGSDGDGPGGAGGNSDAEYEVAQSYYGYEVGGEAFWPLVARKLPRLLTHRSKTVPT